MKSKPSVHGALMRLSRKVNVAEQVGTESKPFDVADVRAVVEYVLWLEKLVTKMRM